MPGETVDIAHVLVVIVNYKNWMDTRECLDFLFRSDYRSFTAIVVDNASGNDSLQRLMEWADHAGDPPPADLPFLTGKLPKPIPYRFFGQHEWERTVIHKDGLPQLVFLQSDRNGGFAAGNNLALRALAQEDAWVWLLNPDVIVRPDTLGESVRFAGSQPFRTISGAVTKNYTAPHAIHTYGGARINRKSGTVTFIKSPAELEQLDYISGGALFTHTAHLREIGLLSEEYFLYWEETDWCFRARQKGYAIKVCETAICYDKIGTSIGRGFLAEYYYTRNGLVFLSRYGGRDVFGVRLGFTLLRLLKRILSGQWGKARGVVSGAMAFLKMSKTAKKKQLENK